MPNRWNCWLNGTSLGSKTGSERHVRLGERRNAPGFQYDRGPKSGSGRPGDRLYQIAPLFREIPRLSRQGSHTLSMDRHFRDIHRFVPPEQKTPNCIEGMPATERLIYRCKNREEREQAKHALRKEQSADGFHGIPKPVAAGTTRHPVIVAKETGRTCVYRTEARKNIRGAGTLRKKANRRRKGSRKTGNGPRKPDSKAAGRTPDRAGHNGPWAKEPTGNRPPRAHDPHTWSGVFHGTAQTEPTQHEPLQVLVQIAQKFVRPDIERCQLVLVIGEIGRTTVGRHDSLIVLMLPLLGIVDPNVPHGHFPARRMRRRGRSADRRRWP